MFSPYFQQQQIPQMQNNNQNSQIGNNGYVIVRSEEEARNYPLAPGFSMTFFNETQPYCYKKTMSFSPLDHPVFETYKIVKEETAAPDPVKEQVPEWRSEINAIQDELERLNKEVLSLKNKPKTAPKRKEDVKDDSE